MSGKKYVMVPMNVRYKEFYVVEVPEDSENPLEDAQDAVASGDGDQVESLNEYVDVLDREHWDDPYLISEEEYQEHTKDEET